MMPERLERFLHILKKEPTQDEITLNAFIGKVQRREIKEFTIGNKHRVIIDCYGKWGARIRIPWGEPHEGRHLEKSYFVKVTDGQLEVRKEGFFNADNRGL